MLADGNLGCNIHSSLQTLGRYLDHWLKICAGPRLRTKSFHDYTRLLARYVRPRLGSRSLAKLSAAEIQALSSEQLNRNLSTHKIRYTHTVRLSAWRQAVRWKLLLTNLVEGVDLPRQPRRCFIVLDVEQAKQFIAAISGHKYEAWCALAIMTGMRQSE